MGTEPKIEEVYRCPECDVVFSESEEAAKHCFNPGIPKEYKCLNCAFIWPTAEQAIRCFDIEAGDYAELAAKLPEPA